MPQVLLLRAVHNQFSAQPVSVLGIAPAQVQDIALGLVEPHKLHKTLDPTVKQEAHSWCGGGVLCGRCWC